MILDHIGLYFFPSYYNFRMLGRLAFPIFCFYAGYNFHNKLNWHILFYGILLHLFTIIFYDSYRVPNILISIFIGQIFLFFVAKHSFSRIVFVIYSITLGMGWIVTRSYFEYGSLAALMMIIGYYQKNLFISSHQAAKYITIFSFMHTILVFGVGFNVVNKITLIMGLILLYNIMTLPDRPMPQISLLRTISRNSLKIYFYHLIIFMLLAKVIYS